MGLSGIFAAGSVLSVLAFIAKPLIILIVCKFAIDALLKIVDKMFAKASLDKGIKTFTKSAIRIALWAITIIIVAGSLGVDTASLVTVLGVASLALSLAVQGIFSNVFAGIVILLTKPFVVGDFVDICGVTGTVTSVDLMRTILNTGDNKVEMIPNGDINSSRITNYSKEPLRRVDLSVAVSYDAPTDVVKKAVLDVINADTRVIVEDGKMPFVRLSGYNANDISYTIRVWVNNADYWDVYFDTLENLRTSFAKHGVEFSYPHTIVHTVDK